MRRVKVRRSVKHHRLVVGELAAGGGALAVDLQRDRLSWRDRRRVVVRDAHAERAGGGGVNLDLAQRHRLFRRIADFDVEADGDWAGEADVAGEIRVDDAGVNGR